MTRANDLDNIAPDDPIIESKSEKKEIEPEITEPKNEDCQNDKVRELLGHTKSPFSPTLVYPDIFDFSERDSDEKIYVVLRPHWFTNVHWILTAIIMFFAPIFYTSLDSQLPVPTNIMMFVYLFWYLAIFAYSLEKFISWYFDIFIITNNRVIDIDVCNLLDRKFTEAQLKKIQDTSYKVSGVSQTIFNYGSVKVETAGENPDIVFEKVSHPEKIIKLLQHLSQNAYKHK
jgi:hypothetical protein